MKITKKYQAYFLRSVGICIAVLLLIWGWMSYSELKCMEETASMRNDSRREEFAKLDPAPTEEEREKYPGIGTASWELRAFTKCYKSKIGILYSIY